MTIQEQIDKLNPGLQEIIPGAELERENGKWVISLSDLDCTVTMADLDALAVCFGSKKISVRTTAPEPHYSDLTPGAPGGVYLEITPEERP